MAEASSLDVFFGGKPKKPPAYHIRLIDGVDGEQQPASHARVMKQFVQALVKPSQLGSFQLLGIPDAMGKDMGNIYEQVKRLNTDKAAGKSVDYILLPAGLFVAVNKFSKALSREGLLNQKLTPETLYKAEPVFMAWAQRVAEDPQARAKALKILYGDENTDPQNIGALYPLVQELNKASEQGIKVLMIGGNFRNLEFRDEARQQGLMPELYDTLSSGKDRTGQIGALRERLITQNSWDELNLLSFAKIETVSIDNPDEHPYFFSTRNDLNTTSARGAFNLAPIRDPESRSVVGYSFTRAGKKPDVTPESFWGSEGEFWGVRRPERLEQFLGLPIESCLASPQEHAKMRRIVRRAPEERTPREQAFLTKMDDKLFRIRDIYPPERIQKQKLDLLGDYIDARGELVLKTNRYGEIIFSKFDCEASEPDRPSCFPLYGTCFGIVQALSDDISKRQAEEAYRSRKSTQPPGQALNPLV
jgi:hypothetical protein